MKGIKKGLILALYVFVCMSVVSVVKADTKNESNFLDGKTVEKNINGKGETHLIVSDKTGMVWFFENGNVPEDWTDSNGNTYWLMSGDQVALMKTAPPKTKNAVLRVPDTITHDGKVYRVTQVGDPFCFEWSVRFKSTLGKGYKKIIYGKNVKEISQKAHAKVRSIEEITFTGEKVSISQYAFWCCKNLKKINGLNRVKYIYPYAFCGAGLKSLKLGDVHVYWSAFTGCDNLSKVVITKGDGIAENTFFDCENLKTVIVKKGVKYISNSAFGNCTKLQKVTLPQTIKAIGKEAFACCNNPKLKITIPKTNKYYYVQNNCIISRKKKEVVSVFGLPKIIVIPSDVKKVDSGAMILDAGKKKQKDKSSCGKRNANEI